MLLLGSAYGSNAKNTDTELSDSEIFFIVSNHSLALNRQFAFEAILFGIAVQKLVNYEAMFKKTACSTFQELILLSFRVAVTKSVSRLKGIPPASVNSSCNDSNASTFKESVITSLFSPVVSQL